MRDLLWTFFVYPIYFLKLIMVELNTLQKHPPLLAIQLQIWGYYFLFYPFLRHTYEKVKSGQDLSELVYGETPISSFQKIIKDLPLSENDRFVDLGCGKGMLALYMAQVQGIPATGIDIIPTFIKKATQLANRYRIHKAEFKKAPILEADLTKVTIVYLAWTCLTHETRTQLIEKLATELPDGAIVITTTYPLQDPRFTKMGSQTVQFSWSPGTVFMAKLGQT